MNEPHRPPPTESMRGALEHLVAANDWECQNYTSGIGSCYREGRTLEAQYGADRACMACFCHVSLVTLSGTSNERVKN